MTAGRLAVRPLGPDDTDAAVAASNAAQPHHPWSADDLETYWRVSEREGAIIRLIIEDAGRAAGWLCATMWRSATEGQGHLLLFLPGASSEDLDRAWAFAEDAAVELGMRLGRTGVWEDDAPALEALARRGWERKRRERFWRLELDGLRERLPAMRDAARGRVEAGGLRLVTAAELGGEAIYPALHRVNTASAADIPRSVPFLPLSYDAWLEWMRPARVRPERVWVAVADGHPVGYSYLDYSSTPVTTGYTGVLRDHRGKGVARALKIETLAQAIDMGLDAVETDNDYENRPILHLNEELGYREIRGMLQLHKPLAG